MELIFKKQKAKKLLGTVGTSHKYKTIDSIHSGYPRQSLRICFQTKCPTLCQTHWHIEII